MIIRALLISALLPLAVIATAPPPPVPTFADVSFGPHPHQLMDIHLPKGDGPFPVMVWYGGLWEASKHVPDLNHFHPFGVAVVGVESRTLKDAVADKLPTPIAYPMRDAVRVVQFLRLNAAKYHLDPDRIAVGGGSQGSLPALFVGCAPDQARPEAAEAVERVSSHVTCVAAFRSQPSIDPKHMQEWVPGVEWGAPALGLPFDQSLKKREELLPVIRQWSPDWLLHKGSAPVYFENEWGMTQPASFTEANYKVHSPAWGMGFRKLAEQAGVSCLNKYPGHPTEGYNDIWDFIVKQLKKPVP